VQLPAGKGVARVKRGSADQPGQIAKLQVVDFPNRAVGQTGVVAQMPAAAQTSPGGPCLA